MVQRERGRGQSGVGIPSRGRSEAGSRRRFRGGSMPSMRRMIGRTGSAHGRLDVAIARRGKGTKGQCLRSHGERAARPGERSGRGTEGGVCSLRQRAEGMKHRGPGTQEDGQGSGGQRPDEVILHAVPGDIGPGRRRRRTSCHESQGISGLIPAGRPRTEEVPGQSPPLHRPAQPQLVGGSLTQPSPRSRTQRPAGGQGASDRCASSRRGRRVSGLRACRGSRSGAMWSTRSGRPQVLARRRLPREVGGHQRRGDGPGGRTPTTSAPGSETRTGEPDRRSQNREPRDR